MGFVDYEEDGYVGIMTINRPQALNALNKDVLKDIEAAFDAVDLSRIRTIILTGAGEKSFVAGADIAAMSTMTKAEGEAFGKFGNDIFRKIETFPIPVIAAVNGFALGGGNELAMSCDTYALFRPSIPYVCIGHQYLFLHQDFDFPDKSSIQLWMLRFFTRMTALRSSKKLALSFKEMDQDDEQHIVAVPPLIRQEVTAIQAEEGNYIHGYMVNAGFSDSVEQFHAMYPEVPLKFFWDKADAEEVTRIDETLSYHQIDDLKFLNGMAGCRAYATTAGFESICEAMYLGKPVLMVPAHIEQDCNAYDAMKAGAGIVSDSFNLKSLLRFAGSYSPNRNFVRWVRSSERRIIIELEKLAASQSAVNSIPTFTNYLPI